MEFERPLLLAGFGACTSVGLSAAQSCSAVLSGVSRIAHQSRYPGARRAEPAIVARQDCLADDAPCADRIRQLAFSALQQALLASADCIGIATRRGRKTVPVLLSLPPVRPGLPAQSIASIAADICGSVPQVSRVASGVVDSGQPGFIVAMAKAAELLQNGMADICIVGAADSPLDLDYLHWLDSTDRIKHRANAFGLVPGEGAAFAVVMRDVEQGAMPGSPKVVLRALGLSAEPRPWYMDEPTRGDGLTAALAETLPPGVCVDTCYGDLTGETWRSAEWDFAYLRHGRSFAHPLDICHPADIWGDTGAASSALLCMLARADLLDDIVPRRRSLIFSASDTRPWRAACLLERIDQEAGA